MTSTKQTPPAGELPPIEVTISTYWDGKRISQDVDARIVAHKLAAYLASLTPAQLASLGLGLRRVAEEAEPTEETPPQADPCDRCDSSGRCTWRCDEGTNSPNSPPGVSAGTGAGNHPVPASSGPGVREPAQAPGGFLVDAAEAPGGGKVCPECGEPSAVEYPFCKHPAAPTPEPEHKLTSLDRLIEWRDELRDLFRAGAEAGVTYKKVDVGRLYDLVLRAIEWSSLRARVAGLEAEGRAMAQHIGEIEVEASEHEADAQLAKRRVAELEAQLAKEKRLVAAHGESLDDLLNQNQTLRTQLASATESAAASEARLEAARALPAEFMRWATIADNCCRFAYRRCAEAVRKATALGPMDSPTTGNPTDD